MPDFENSYLTAGATGQVPRTELVRKMKSCSAGKHIYITAASGYGKTVAASQWLVAVRGNKTKLIVDAGDNVPGFFYKRMATALLKFTERANLVADVAISFDRLLEIVQSLPQKSKRCYFIVDDIHLLKNEEIIRRIPIFFQRIPSYIRCCIISRSEPSVALMKTGLFEVITRDDLAFSREEIEWLGVERGIILTSEQAEALQKKTRGWVMYLLALLSGSDEPGVAQSIPADISAGDAYSSFTDETATSKVPLALTKYIQSRVWDHTDRETKRLLLSLSIPEEVCPELCECITCKKGGKQLLRRLSAEENSFLSLTGMGRDTYKFHDIYRKFLLERIETLLSEDEIWRINDVIGKWHYERGDYYEGARHFIRNRDHAGITRCLSESLRYLKETAHISVEVRLNYAEQCLKDLPFEFILENVYLIIWCTSTAFHDGDTEAFLKYMDALYERLPDIASEYPNLMQTAMFVYNLDFRVPLLEQCTELAITAPRQKKSASVQPAVARISSITQNLPYFHRSMRDLSEFFDLNAADLKLIANTYGVVVGKDYAIMEKAAIAGIHYERGEMLEALQYALSGYNDCAEDTHPETHFCSHMILSAILYAMGAVPEASSIMDRMRDYIESDARFLMLNFKALKTIRAIHIGDKNAAREWLDVNAYRSAGPLPFYQICRHFATLHSFIALEDNASAIAFGMRLQALSDAYRRPLDQIESRILIAIAKRRSGELTEAAELFRQAVEIAQPYEFVQSFVNEGREILPMLWELRDNKDAPGELSHFSAIITDAVCRRYLIKIEDVPAPKLSKRQIAMLTDLERGMTYAQISEKLGIPRATVKYHLLTAYKNIGVHDWQEAVMRLRELGLI